MTHYFVVSPEISKVIPILDDGSGPLEYFRCVVTVDASSKAEAKKIAIKDVLMRDWVDEARSDNKNPFSGLKVESPVCNHGVCFCGICKGDCEQCYEEAERG